MKKGPGKIFVLSSPSGGGKTTVARRILRRVRGLSRSVSVTTRPLRDKERNGRDYRFVSRADFNRLRRQKRLVEWANVHGAWYGTPRRPLEEKLARGRSVLLCIDVQGACKIRRVFGKRAVLIFLVPPSIADLRRRLKRRSTETSAAIRARLAAARRELDCAAWYDHRVMNARLSDAITRLEGIITGSRR
jgi:guanylate kinase